MENMIKINRTKLLDLLEPFYNVTGIKVAVYDTDFKEILTYPENDSKFCTIIRNHPVSGIECDRSTQIHCNLCLETKKTEIRQCHAGLTEVVAPLTDGITTIGYIMFGQITNIKDKELFYSTILEKCEKYNLDNEVLLKALKKIRYYSDKQAEDVAKLLNALAAYIVFKKIVQEAEPSLAYIIIEYIKNNLDKDLTATALCKHFYLSKTDLYKITKPYMTDGVARFVKKLRLEKAAELLSETDKPVWKIAEETGYQEVEYFQRIFKKEMGVSALDYRAKATK